ncbi:MAG: cytochrome c oxidase assembly protein, partial [Gemmatimonadaceae bacterium]
MVGFTVVMLATHAPGAVDVLMRSQPGAFLLDMAWFLSGLVFWWPIAIDLPARRHFGPPMRILYLFAGTQAHLYLSMWLLLAEFPAYGIYELAPRVTGLSAMEDQQVAGGLLLLVGGTYVLAVISVLFFRWFAEPQPER